MRASPSSTIARERLRFSVPLRETVVMHAVVATVRVTHKAEARSALETLRLPIVERAPGFVAGYWLERVERRRDVCPRVRDKAGRRGRPTLPTSTAARGDTNQRRNPRGVRVDLADTDGHLHQLSRTRLTTPAAPLTARPAKHAPRRRDAARARIGGQREPTVVPGRATEYAAGVCAPRPLIVVALAVLTLFACSART